MLLLSRQRVFPCRGSHSQQKASIQAAFVCCVLLPTPTHRPYFFLRAVSCGILRSCAATDRVPLMCCLLLPAATDSFVFVLCAVCCVLCAACCVLRAGTCLHAGRAQLHVLYQQHLDLQPKLVVFIGACWYAAQRKNPTAEVDGKEDKTPLLPAWSGMMPNGRAYPVKEELATLTSDFPPGLDFLAQSTARTLAIRQFNQGVCVCACACG